MTLRIYRALSWAEKGLEASGGPRTRHASSTGIAFNAMYARRTDEYSERQEQRDFQQFLDQVALLDSKRTVTNTLKECWDDAKTGLIDNQYVFRGFWTQVDPAGRTTVGGGKALTGTASRWNEPSGMTTTCLC